MLRVLNSQIFDKQNYVVGNLVSKFSPIKFFVTSNFLTICTEIKFLPYGESLPLSGKDLMKAVLKSH